MDTTVNRRAFASNLLWALHKRGVATEDLAFRGELELHYLYEAVDATDAAAAFCPLAGLSAFPEADVLAVHRALAEFCRDEMASSR